MDSNYPGMVMPLMWPELQANGNRQQYEQQQQWHLDAHQQPVWGREENQNFVTPENSLLSYDSGNSGRYNFGYSSQDTYAGLFGLLLLLAIEKVDISMKSKDMRWMKTK